MYKDNKVLAIIPARGGSKGIPQKNIKEVKGKPLIGYTIDGAKQSKYIDRIIVSTDDDKIADISKELGADVPFPRPKYLASDSSKTIDTLVYVVEELKSQGYFYDDVVLLQPTQPLRKPWHIDEAIEKIINNNEDSLVSVSLVNEHPVLMREISDEGRLINLLKLNSTMRRQEFPNYYKVNGAIYINKIDKKFDNTVSLNDNSTPYVMDNQYDLDIDTPMDLKLFNYLLEENKGV